METQSLAFNTPKTPFRDDADSQLRFQARKAWDHVLALFCQLQEYGLQLAIPDPKTFCWFAEGFISRQKWMEASRKPSNVSVGYHYTGPVSATMIAIGGLKAMGRQQYFGSGIYTATNPHAFRDYGTVGLVVLVLKGAVALWNAKPSTVEIAGVDSIVGNKAHENLKARRDPNQSHYFDEIVLKFHDQTLPLLRFDRKLESNADLMWRVHQAVETFVFAQFPGQQHYRSSRVFPRYYDIEFQHRLALSFDSDLPSASPDLLQCFAAATEAAERKAAASRRAMITTSDECSILSQPLYSQKKYWTYTWVQSSDDCPICHDDLSEGLGAVVTLSKCGHRFHAECLNEALLFSNRCPMCRGTIGEPIGSCPRGIMLVKVDSSIHCGGFEDIDTIVFTYRIFSGIQSKQHENPGRRFWDTKRIAYLPYTPQSEDLLKRLRYAFRRGLTFHVGTSLTSGRSNEVCWASIRHKTVLKGRAHGWPDPKYFNNCNHELDRLGVPKATEL